MDIKLSDVCACGHTLEWHYEQSIDGATYARYQPAIGSRCRSNIAKYVFCPCNSFKVDNLLYLEKRAYAD